MSLLKLSSALRTGVSATSQATRALSGGLPWALRSGAGAAPQSRQITRAMSGLDFKPVLDPPLDPLEESARSAFEKSCYLKINWKISENAPVIDAISRMVSHKIGALAVTEGDGDGGKVIGVLSERDFLCKVAFLGRDMRTTKASEVCTYGTENLVSVTLDNPIDACMKKMLARDIRHLLIRQKVDTHSHKHSIYTSIHTNTYTH